MPIHSPKSGRLTEIIFLIHGTFCNTCTAVARFSPTEVACMVTTTNPLLIQHPRAHRRIRWQPNLQCWGPHNPPGKQASLAHPKRRQPLLLLRIVDPVILDRLPDGTVSIGRLDGADLDAFGHDAGDAPA